MTSDRMHRETGDGDAFDNAFDAAARDAHAHALDRLSPRVRAQLTQRRRAAMSGPRPSPLRAWPMLALGSAAVLALAIGLFVLPDNRSVEPAPAVAVAPIEPAQVEPTQVEPGPEAPDTAPAPDVVSVEAAPTMAANDPSAPVETTEVVDVASVPDTWLAAEFDDETTGLDAFEENPDFYLWLGSEDGLAEVTESL